MKKIFLFLLLLSPSLSSAQTAPEWAALNQRVEELERQQIYNEAENRKTRVNSFIRDSLTIGGFFEPAFSIIQGEDTRTQATNASNTLGINISAEYTDRLIFVSQFLTGLNFPLQNQHNDPRAVAFNLPETREFGSFFYGALLSQGYLQYVLSESHTISAGIGYVPFGYYPQQRELVLFVRRGGPQILRTTDLFSPLFNGINLQGRFDRGSRAWGYNLYTFNRLEDAKRPGLGTRVWTHTSDEAVAMGLSYQTIKYNRKIESIFGSDLRLNLNKFILTTEYARHITAGQDIWSYYVEPSLYLHDEDLLGYVFFDYSRNPNNKTGSGRTALLDPISKYEYGAGLNYLPTSFTRLRLGFTCHNYADTPLISGQERDYLSLDLSAGVAF